MRCQEHFLGGGQHNQFDPYIFRMWAYQLWLEERGVYRYPTVNHMESEEELCTVRYDGSTCICVFSFSVLLRGEERQFVC